MNERIARVILRVLEAVPLPALASFCVAVMLLVYAVDREHRRIARINLGIAFPEMGDAEADRIIRACYRQMGTSAAEFIHIPRMDPAYIREHFRIEGAGHVRESLEGRKRPTMAMTGHFGNWELLSHVLGSRTKPIAFIVRPL